ncbi:MAG: hypothetical protein ABFD46_11775 [Armatimonadota bacterium]
MKTLVLSTALLLIVCSSIVGAQSDQPVFRENMPSELLKELNEKLTAFRIKYPLSSETEKCVSEAVASLKLVCPSLSIENEKKIQKAGPGAIRVIAELLTAQDKELRLRALMALGIFMKIREEITDEYTEYENLLILLYRRSLFDMDVEMRNGAVWSLFGVGSQRFPKIPPSIINALKDAWINDPDTKVRDSADLALQDLGVIPRDPNREYIIN